MTVTIRAAELHDHDTVWAILESTIRSGETYALPRDGTREAMLAYWFSPSHRVFVAETDEGVRGTYILKANQAGGGSHVANAGFMTRAGQRSRHRTGHGPARLGHRAA